MLVDPDPRVAHGQALSSLARRFPLLGGALTRHQSSRGTPISFRGREYLVELYCVAQREGFDAVKAPQLGLSELLIQLALQEAGWEGRIVAYALPTGHLRDGFVNRRVNRLLRDVPAYRNRVREVDLEALRDEDQPAGSARARKVRTRRQVAELRKMRKSSTDSLKLKRLGSGQILFLGAGSDGDFVEFSADTLILDEYDLCWEASELNVLKAEDRLLESAAPKVYRLGNAETSRRGISSIYEEGDAREWHWKCPRCGEWQPIDWLRNVVDEQDGTPKLLDGRAAADLSRDVGICCLRCRRPFLREEATKRCWVPHRVGVGRKSYRMCRWDSTRTPVRALWTSYLQARISATKLKAWWRAVAARVYEPSSGRLTHSDVMGAAILPPLDLSARATTAGIDVGTLCHFVASNLVPGPTGHVERRAVWVGSIRDEAGVIDALQRHRVEVAVIDGAPEPRFAARVRNAAREFGCKVFVCSFTGGLIPKATDELFGLVRKPEGNGISVDRTQVFDAAADGIRQGRLIGESDPELPYPDVGEDFARLWPSDVDTALGFVSQVCEPVRAIDEKGRAYWTKTERADHYRLADVYDLVATVLYSTGGTY